MTMPKVSTPYGEIFDRITILQIRKRIAGLSHDEQDRLFELKACVSAFHQWGEIQALVTELEEVNQRLWNTEDHIREISAYKEVALAAFDVINLNNRRCEIKHKINQMTGTNQEKKVYSNVEKG